MIKFRSNKNKQGTTIMLINKLYFLTIMLTREHIHESKTPDNITAKIFNMNSFDFVFIDNGTKTS